MSPMKFLLPLVLSVFAVASPAQSGWSIVLPQYPVAEIRDVLTPDMAALDLSSVKELYLQSEGGDIVTAAALADQVRKYHITTIVPAYCASACILIFAAGSERIAAPDARFGFHSPHVDSNAGSEFAVKFSEELGRERYTASLLRDGYPAEFIKSFIHSRELHIMTGSQMVQQHLADTLRQPSK